MEKNLHLPQLVGVYNILEFEMKGGDVMVLKFFVKTDKDGNEINSWYYETWKRVKMCIRDSYSFSQVVLTYFMNMLGNEALATRTYVVNIVMFVYLFAIAMAQGGAICIGHLVGERKLHAAYLLGKYVMRISILVSLVLSCIWALMGHTLFSWLTDNPEIIRLGTIILFIDVILEVGRAINIYATNALRATGDVNYPFYVGFVVQWSVAVGCGFLFGIHWGWGLVGMWCAFVLDENLRGIIFVQRWNSLKWTKKGFVK